MSLENVFVDAPQEGVFSSAMAFLDERHMKILHSTPPSFIRAEIGSYNSMSLSEAKGEVEINMTATKDGCHVTLKFSFIKDYAADMMVAAAGSCILSLFAWLLPEKLSFPASFYQSATFTLIVSMAVSFPIAAFALARYSTSLTKRKFMEAFKRIILSVHNKRDKTNHYA
jgi:hypothetical protein